MRLSQIDYRYSLCRRGRKNRLELSHQMILNPRFSLLIARINSKYGEGALFFLFILLRYSFDEIAPNSVWSHANSMLSSSPPFFSTATTHSCCPKPLHSKLALISRMKFLPHATSQTDSRALSCRRSLLGKAFKTWSVPIPRLRNWITGYLPRELTSGYSTHII